MKEFKVLLAALGILSVIALVSVAVYQMIQNDETDSAPGADGEAPMVSVETVDAVKASTAVVEKNIAWIMTALCVVLQLWAWIAATRKLGKVRRSAMSAAARLQRLEAIEVYFDLPLYLGLLGTVLSFILITIYPNAGLMFAYASTALGIVVSLALRLIYLTPYRERLITTSQPGEQVRMGGDLESHDSSLVQAGRNANDILK